MIFLVEGRSHILHYQDGADIRLHYQVNAHVLGNFPLSPRLLPRHHLGLGTMDLSKSDTSKAGSVSYIRDGFHLIWVSAMLADARSPKGH